MIRTLNAWRGIMAALIVAFHYTQSYELQVMGDFRMSFFFVVSGFLLAQRYAFDALSWKEYKAFMRRRVLRIFPLHWLVLGLFVLMLGVQYLLTRESDFSVSNFMLQALLLQSWSPSPEVNHALNTVTWFLSSMMFCYLCYPFVKHFFGRMKIVTQLLIVLVALAVFMTVQWHLDGETRKWFVFMFPPMRLVDFSLGVVLCTIWERGHQDYERMNVPIWKSLAELGVVALMVLVTMLQYHGVINRFDSRPLKILLTGFLVLVLAMGDVRGGLLSRALQGPVLCWLGRISYEVYVWQILVLLALRNGLAQMGIELREPFMALIYVCLLLLLSWQSNVRIGRWVKRLRK